MTALIILIAVCIVAGWATREICLRRSLAKIKMPDDLGELLRGPVRGRGVLDGRTMIECELREFGDGWQVTILAWRELQEMWFPRDRSVVGEVLPGHAITEKTCTLTVDSHQMLLRGRLVDFLVGEAVADPGRCFRWRSLCVLYLVAALGSGLVARACYERLPQVVESQRMSTKDGYPLLLPSDLNMVKGMAKGTAFLPLVMLGLFVLSLFYRGFTSCEAFATMGAILAAYYAFFVIFLALSMETVTIIQRALE
jgi:hypothetical protein